MRFLLYNFKSPQKSNISLMMVAKFYEMELCSFVAESSQCELTVISLNKKDVKTTRRFKVRPPQQIKEKKALQYV